MVQQAAPPVLTVTHQDGTTTRLDGRAAAIVASVVVHAGQVNRPQQGHLHFTWGPNQTVPRKMFEDYWD